MATKTQKLSFQAGLTAARLIVAGARREVDKQIRSGEPNYSKARLAARGAALSALEELYFEGLTPAAQNRLRRMHPLNGYSPLLAISGWNEVP